MTFQPCRPATIKLLPYESVPFPLAFFLCHPIQGSKAGCCCQQAVHKLNPPWNFRKQLRQRAEHKSKNDQISRLGGVPYKPLQNLCCK